MSTRRSSRRAAAPSFPQLAPGVQAGLRALVSSHSDTIAQMLDAPPPPCDNDQDDNINNNSSNKDTTPQQDNTRVDALCEQCAGVMKQQQLSVSSFLARFFALEILQEHAEFLKKSSKGSVAVLSERIAGEWSKNRLLLIVKEREEKEENGEENEKEKDETKPKTKKRTTDEKKEDKKSSKKHKIKGDAAA